MKVFIDPSVKSIILVVNFMHLVKRRVDVEESVAPVTCKVFDQVHDLHLNEQLE